MNALNISELPILNAIQEITNPVLDVLMQAFSFACEIGWLFILLGIIMIITKKYRVNGFILLLSLLLNLIISNVILKNAVCRIRPYDIENSLNMFLNGRENMLWLARGLTDWSFPSGHASASFAAALIFSYSNKKWIIPAYAMAVFTSFSRLYLYVHYPTDVILGAAIGTLSAVIMILLFKFIVIPKILPRFKKNDKLTDN